MCSYTSSILVLDNIIYRVIHQTAIPLYILRHLIYSNSGFCSFYERIGVMYTQHIEYHILKYFDTIIYGV